MASTERKANNAMEPCDIPCVPQFQKNTNTSVTKKCDDELLSSSQCHLETSLENRFYNAINWNVLTRNIDTWMGYFVEELNNNHALASLIQQAYKFGPIHDESAASNRFGRLGFKVLNDEHLRFCNNIVVKLTLTSKGGRQQFLSHISLHPKLPIYYRDTRRSRSGCGYYQRHATLNKNAARGRTANGSGSGARSRNAEVESETGPFHYKVDTLYWKDKPFHYGQKHIPFMEFQPDPAHPGHFLEGMGDFRDAISRNEIILEKKKPKKLEDSVALELKSRAVETARRELGGKKANKAKELEVYKVLLSDALASMHEPEANSDDEGALSRDLLEQIEALNRIHQTITHDFLKFWNEKLLVGVEAQRVRANLVNQYPGFPSILKSAEGGKRRTRKVRR